MAYEFCLKMPDFQRNIQGSFTCRKSRTWDKRGFTSLPKEGVLRIFSP